MIDIIRTDDLADRVGTEELSDKETWRAVAAEYIGTLTFVFLGVGAVVASFSAFGDSGRLTAERLVLIALGHGFAIAAVMWAIGHVSGGHVNPAVTIAAVAGRQMKLAKGALYVAAQLLGAVSGAFLLKAVVPDSLEGGLGANVLSGQMAAESAALGFLVEVILTFFLVFVIFSVAMNRREASSLAPLAVGLTYMLGIFMGYSLTGASMNPARTLGPAWAADVWSDHWLYWAGPIAGGILAAVVCQSLIPKRGESSESEA